MLLQLLAEQPTEQSLSTDEIGRVLLKDSRQVAEEFSLAAVVITHTTPKALINI